MRPTPLDYSGQIALARFLGCAGGPIPMPEMEASASPPALPRWFGPRASPDDPAVSALIDRVARGAGWADIGGGFNPNLRLDPEPPVVLPGHRPRGPPGPGAGLRPLRERPPPTRILPP